MLSKLTLFTFLPFIWLINVYVSVGEEDTCNYWDVSELLFLIIGLFPGHYAENYCISVVQDAGRNPASLKFVCDSSGVGWLEGYEDDSCENLVNTTRLNTTEYVCDATDECTLYTMYYSTYNDTSDCDTTPVLDNSYTQFNIDDCFDLTVFGFDTGITASTDIDPDSYILTLYNGTTPCTGFSQSLELYADCVGNDTVQVSYNLDIDSDGGSGTSDSDSGSSSSGAVFYGQNIIFSKCLCVCLAFAFLLLR